MPLPIITKISPNAGPAGTAVTIAGEGFTGATAVEFGVIASTGMTVNSDTQITAVSPPGGAGTVDICVITPAGSSVFDAADQFTYTPAVTLPVITGIYPNTGLAGTAVTVTGTGFSGATTVSFGAMQATSALVNSDTQITAVSPLGGAGTVDITVSTPAGRSVSSIADQFTYSPSRTLPVITAVYPSNGPAGIAVTITGAGFTGATSVAFGPVGSSNITVNSDTQVVAVSPAGGNGTVDITVTTPAGASAPTPSDRFVLTLPNSLSTTTSLGDGGVNTNGGVNAGVPTLGASGTVGGVSSAGYYVDPSLTSQLTSSIVNILQSASSPDALEAKNILLRRIALQGDVIGSRIPPPKNISEIGGYINLLTALRQPEIRSQALAGILGVAGPSEPLGWVSNNQPLAFVTLPNDRPQGVSQPTLSLTFMVRSDFSTALQTALSVLHQQGCTLPIAGLPAVTLPQAMPGIVPPDDVLPYLGRTLDLAVSAALLNPQSDPLALVRSQGTPGPFEIASNVMTPGVIQVAPANYDAVQCNLSSCSLASVPNGQYVLVAPILALAGFYTASPLPLPTSISSNDWARFTNLTGLVRGVTKLGDELSLLFNWGAINHSVFAGVLHRVWDGSKFA